MKHSSQLTCLVHIAKEDQLDECFRILGWNPMGIAIVKCNQILSNSPLTCLKGLAYGDGHQDEVASPRPGGGEGDLVMLLGRSREIQAAS